MSEKISNEQMDVKESLNSDLAESKKDFIEPKLKFIEPKLTKHGDATKITGGFFGSFSP
jgi:hypothetical protein